VIAEVKAGFVNHGVGPGVALGLGEAELAVGFEFGGRGLEEAHPAVFAKGVNAIVGEEGSAFYVIGLLVEGGAGFGVNGSPTFAAAIE
jgi:hypothetical protein